MSLNQSCGKCIPCRDGLVEAERLLGSILNGDATEKTREELEKLCRMISETADCAVGVVAANTVLDSLKDFADEYDSHINNKCCHENVIQTVPCMTLCPADDIVDIAAVDHKLQIIFIYQTGPAAAGLIVSVNDAADDERLREGGRSTDYFCLHKSLPNIRVFDPNIIFMEDGV